MVVSTLGHCKIAGATLPTMYTLHCTRKLLDRFKQPISAAPLAPTTTLGNWYATVLFWKPQVALLVNERTLLPVLMPLAPAAKLADFFPAHLTAVLHALGVDANFIAREVEAMAQSSLAKTANRSVVGSMNEFSFLAEGYRDVMGTTNLLALTLRLADTPCSPIKYSSPVRALREIVASGVS